MINLNQIQRLLDSGAFHRVIARVLANGRCHSPAVSRRLTETASAPVAATALALQRCCELTYGPSPMATALAEALGRMQQADGGFGCPAVTAVAARAFMLWQDNNGGSPLPHLDRALANLARSQDQRGLLGGDAVGSAIALWQLGDREAFQTCLGEVHWHRLVDAVRRSAGERTGEEFSRFAYAMAA